MRCLQTGTLTEDGLDMWGVVPVEDGALAEPVKDPRNLPDTHPLLCAMAACHSLTRIDGDLAGDPLDVKVSDGNINISVDSSDMSMLVLRVLCNRIHDWVARCIIHTAAEK